MKGLRNDQTEKKYELERAREQIIELENQLTDCHKENEELREQVMNLKYQNERMKEVRKEAF